MELRPFYRVSRRECCYFGWCPAPPGPRFQDVFDAGLGCWGKPILDVYAAARRLEVELSLWFESGHMTLSRTERRLLDLPMGTIEELPRWQRSELGALLGDAGTERLAALYRNPRQLGLSGPEERRDYLDRLLQVFMNHGCGCSEITLSGESEPGSGNRDLSLRLTEGGAFLERPVHGPDGRPLPPALIAGWTREAGPGPDAAFLGRLVTFFGQDIADAVAHRYTR
jgi:hypothetical protein